jgi:hypothetical protein
MDVWNVHVDLYGQRMYEKATALIKAILICVQRISGSMHACKKKSNLIYVRDIYND